LADCAEASAAAPIYFNPKVIGNQTLVDGGIIANEPALYAFLHAKYALSVDPSMIRMVSIGTGMSLSEDINITTATEVTWLEQISSALITSVEQYTHEYLVMRSADEYYRF